MYVSVSIPRPVIDSDGHMPYYSQQNSKVFQEKAPQAIPLTSDVSSSVSQEDVAL